MPKTGQINLFDEGVQACPEAGEYKTVPGQFGIEKTLFKREGKKMSEAGLRDPVCLRGKRKVSKSTPTRCYRTRANCQNFEIAWNRKIMPSPSASGRDAWGQKLFRGRFQDIVRQVRKRQRA